MQSKTKIIADVQAQAERSLQAGHGKDALTAIFLSAILDVLFDLREQNARIIELLEVKR